MNLKVLLMSMVIAAGGASAAPAAPIARPDAGDLKGEAAAGGSLVFRGIPYAAPPVGALRWRAPQPVPRWTGQRDATAFGPSCPQNDFPGDANPLPKPYSEDCLYLNIWTPPGAPLEAAAKLPVLVSIHGGGLVNGGAGGAVFDGTALAQRGIVVVTLNYRLGRLGFFSHPALKAAGGDGADVSFGYLDQIAALQWVRRNIAAFGGDPEQVTIAGESAGGASVQTLMASPLAQGLFSAAIAQSAPARLPFPSADAALQAGDAFADAAAVRKATPETLRAIPVDKVLDGVTFFHQDPKVYSGPVIDGKLIPEQLMETFQRGCQARVPYMVGTTGLELGALPGVYAALGFQKLPEPDRTAILAAYDPDHSRNRGEVAAEALSDQAFAEPARAMARLAARVDQPVWIYRFEYVVGHSRGAQRGAFHASDVPYTFDTLDLVDPKATPADLQMAHAVGDYWANFVKFHDPNGASQPTWPQAGRSGDQILRFTSEGPVAGSDPRKARLDVLERLAKPVKPSAVPCSPPPTL